MLICHLFNRLEYGEFIQRCPPSIFPIQCIKIRSHKMAKLHWYPRVENIVTHKLPTEWSDEFMLSPIHPLEYIICRCLNMYERFYLQYFLLSLSLQAPITFLNSKLLRSSIHFQHSFNRSIKSTWLRNRRYLLWKLHPSSSASLSGLYISQ